MSWDREAYEFVKNIIDSLPKKKRFFKRIGKFWIEMQRDKGGYVWLMITDAEGIKLLEAQLIDGMLDYIDLASIGWVDDFQKIFKVRAPILK